jgi:hypothetical protein
MATLKVYKGRKSKKVTGLRKIKARKPVIEVSPAEQLSKVRSVVDSATSTRNRIDRAKIEKEYQQGNLDDVAKLDELIALYKKQAERATEPADKLELENKILSSENRRNGILLFEKVDERKNEWDKKLSQVDNLKRAGKYAEAYDLAFSVKIEQRDAYQEIVGKLPDDAYLRNKYNDTVTGKLNKIDDQLLDLSELNDKQMGEENKRTIKEGVKAVLRDIGEDISTMYKDALKGQTSKDVDGIEKPMTFNAYYQALQLFYDRIDEWKSGFMMDPDSLEIINNAIKEETYTLKPDTTGGQSFEEMRKEVEDVLTNPHYKNILKRDEISGNYTLGYVNADTSDAAWKNHGTMKWNGVDVLIPQTTIGYKPNGQEIKGFRVPEFGDNLDDIGANEKLWVLDYEGKYVDFSHLSKEDKNRYESDLGRLNNAAPGAKDIITIGTNMDGSMPTLEGGKLPNLEDIFKNKFKNNDLVGPRKQELPGLEDIGKGNELPGPRITNGGMDAFMAPSVAPRSEAPLPSPFGAPDLRSNVPNLPTPPSFPTTIPSMNMPMPNMAGPRINVGMPKSFEHLKNGVSSTLGGDKRFNLFYDLLNRKNNSLF